MTTQEQDPGHQLGYLEGRMEEQAVALQDLKAGQQELRTEVRADIAEVRVGQQELGRRMDAGLQEVRERQQELSRRLESGLQDVRAGQKQITSTLLLISGGLVATLMGGLVALVIRIG